MRTFLLFGLILFFNIAFSQDAEIKEINQLIGPKFKVSSSDKIGCGFFDNFTHKNFCAGIKKVDIDNDGINELIVVGHDTIKFQHGNAFRDKIFVLKKINTHLQIIDSSTTFSFIKGTNVEIKNDTIIVNSLIHAAGLSNIYVFNKALKKYTLREVKYFEGYVKSPKDTTVTYNIIEDYNLSNKNLKIETKILVLKNQKWTTAKQDSKLAYKALPTNLPLNLAEYIDPYLSGNNFEFYYSKMFICFPSAEYTELWRFFE